MVCNGTIPVRSVRDIVIYKVFRYISIWQKREHSESFLGQGDC